MAAPGAHFFGEERLHCCLGPVLTHPPPDPTPVRYPYAGSPQRARPMTGTGGRAAVPQTLLHRRPDPRPALPVPSVRARGSLPAPLPRQHGYRVGQSAGPPAPRAPPRESLPPPHSAAGTFHPPRAVAPFPGPLPHRQVTPRLLFPEIGNLRTSWGTPRNARLAGPSVDRHPQGTRRCFSKRNCFLIKVSRSTSFGSFRFPWSEITKVNRCEVLFQITVNPQPQASAGLHLPLHFWDRNPKKDKAV